MKLSRSTLKRIIKEELENITEKEEKLDHKKAKEMASNPDAIQQAVFDTLDKDPEVQKMIGEMNEGKDPFEGFPVATTYAATMSPVTALASGPLAAKVAGILGVSLAGIPAAAGVGLMAGTAAATIALAYLYDKKKGNFGDKK
tara:strand:- start:4861 stop:5289 length:429 start_codon:yes stop_codon:yes gene_type:complete